MKITQVQVRSLALNAKNISHETIDGVDHYVVRGVVPIVDDVVMNGGLYPASEINSSFKSIEGNLMPMSHPKIGTDYVSAHNPRAINKFHVGAWAENVRKDGGKVVMDMKVNSQMANATTEGKRLIDRLSEMEKGEGVDPINISTGLLLNRQEMKGNSKGKDYSWIASNMSFDHVAILLDEQGAATPDDGVGIFVNAQDEREDSDIIQCNLNETIDNTKTNWLQKVKNYITNATQYSFDDVTSAIYNKLRALYPNDDYVWPSVVYSDYFIYTRNGSSFKQSYVMSDDGEAEFAGDPVEVVKDPTTYSIKTNGDNDQMKTMIINALKAKGINTDGLTDEQLFAKFSEVNAEKPEEKPATKPVDEDADEDGKKKPKPTESAANADVLAALQAISTRLDGIEANAAKQQDAELSALKATVKSACNMSDEAVNAMPVAALKELAANFSHTHGVSTLMGNRANDQQASVMPE